MMCKDNNNAQLVGMTMVMGMLNSMGGNPGKGPFKSDVNAKIRFLDPLPSLVTICHYFGLPPLIPLSSMSPVQTVTNY